MLVFASGYLDASRRGRAVAALTGLFLVTLVGLLCARDVVTFLVSWELMTLVPAAIILVWHAEETARRSVFVYVGGHASRGRAASGSRCSSWPSTGRSRGVRSTASSSTGALVAVAALVGFGAKAGVMPLHVWLPRAHPLAPAHVSALMSGVMIKVALYGLMRVLFEWLDRPPLWLGVVVLALGAVSALGGIVYALFQHELKRLLAFSSIENVGIILLGLGAALVLRARGRTRLGVDRVRGGAAAHDQPRGLQGVAVPRGGLVRRAPCTGSSSTGSAACCAACRGQAARS